FFAAADDATRPFGDADEDSFAAAMAWLSGTQPKTDAMGDVKVDVPEPLGVAGFDATWPVNQDAPLNPDGSVRSF
ncbi:MAG: hypothetical protein VX314_03790, partial [Pseudomonadota bacterium]|nr:hypothetical protein [Pseudomonadota bacterium]